MSNRVPYTERDVKSILKQFKRKHGDGFATKSIIEIYDLHRQCKVNNINPDKIKYSQKSSFHLSKPTKFSHKGDGSGDGGGDTTSRGGELSFWGYKLPLRFEYIIQKLLSWIGNRFSFAVDALYLIPTPVMASYMEFIPIGKLEELDRLYDKIKYQEDPSKSSPPEDGDSNRSLFNRYITIVSSLFTWVFDVMAKSSDKTAIDTERSKISLDDINRERKSILSEISQWGLTMTSGYFNIIGRIVTQTYSYVSRIKDVIYSTTTSIMSSVVTNVSSILENFSGEFNISDDKPTTTTTTTTNIDLNIKGKFVRIKRKFTKLFLLYTQTMNKISHSNTTTEKREEEEIDKETNISNVMIPKITQRFVDIIKELSGLTIFVRTSVKLKKKFTSGILNL